MSLRSCFALHKLLYQNCIVNMWSDKTRKIDSSRAIVFTVFRDKVSICKLVDNCRYCSEKLEVIFTINISKLLSCHDWRLGESPAWFASLYQDTIVRMTLCSLATKMSKHKKEQLRICMALSDRASNCILTRTVYWMLHWKKETEIMARL